MIDKIEKVIQTITQKYIDYCDETQKEFLDRVNDSHISFDNPDDLERAISEVRDIGYSEGVVDMCVNTGTDINRMTTELQEAIREIIQEETKTMAIDALNPTEEK